MIEYKVTLYGCEFKCGHRHTKNKSSMQAHERRCWYNPERRTCKTCRHEDYFDDNSGYNEYGHLSEPPWWCRNCKLGTGTTEKMIDAIYVHLERDNPENTKLYGIQIPPVIDCDFWEGRE